MRWPPDSAGSMTAIRPPRPRNSLLSGRSIALSTRGRSILASDVGGRRVVLLEVAEVRLRPPELVGRNRRSLAARIDTRLDLGLGHLVLLVAVIFARPGGLTRSRPKALT